MIEYTGQVVKCGKYAASLFVTIASCKICAHHRGLVEINEAVNGKPEVFDILCGLPVHRRVEYVVKEVDNGGTK